jgi:type II secretory pathway pseudopilin PulG
MKSTEIGVTLKELVVTLAVIGVTTALGLPHLVEMIPNYRLTSAARSLVVQIHRARLRAINQSTICYFDFDLDGDGDLESEGCFLWGDRNRNRRKELLEKGDMVFDLGLFPKLHLKAYPAELGGPERGPNNTKINAGGGDGVSFAQNRIKFNPDGTCSTGTIYLHNSKGRTFAIRLRSNCLTQLWKHYGQGWERW